MILRLVEGYAPLWLAALLGAAVMAAVMASDSQILALSTMFTEDVFAFYGGTARFGPTRCRCRPGGSSSSLLTVVAYVDRAAAPQSIFDLATQYAFAGYSALSPLLVAALFWQRQHEVGRAGGDRCGRRRRWPASPMLQTIGRRRRRRAPRCRCCRSAGIDVVTRVAAGTMVLGLLPVVPMTLISALLMVVVSSLTPCVAARAGDADAVRRYDERTD